MMITLITMIMIIIIIIITRKSCIWERVPIYPIDSLHCLKWLNYHMIIVLVMIIMIIIIIIMIMIIIIITIMIIIIIIMVNILIIGILPISGQNRHPSTEHDQYKVAWGSSTCYRGIFPQRSHPQGKIGEVNGKIHQTVSMILFSIFLVQAQLDWKLTYSNKN